MGVQGVILRHVEGLVDQINPEGWYVNTYKELENVYVRFVMDRSPTFQYWISDRSCSLLIMDISLMDPLDHDEYAC